MIENDTIRLLRECDAGAKMGIAAIKDVLDNVKDGNLKKILENGKNEHEALQDEITSLLHEYHDEGKEPNPVAKTMSWFKTGYKMATDGSDRTIADLITDGCDMGVKSLEKYLNRYKAADERSKDLCKRIIRLEEWMRDGMKQYL